MAVKSTKKPRRTDPRKIAPLGPSYTWANLGRKRAPVGIMLAVGFAVVAGAIMLYSRAQPRYRVGQVVDRAIYPRVEVQWEDTKQTEFMRQMKQDETATVYKLNTAFVDKFRLRLLTLPGLIAQMTSLNDFDEELVAVFDLKNNLQVMSVLKRYQAEGNPTDTWQQMVDQFISNIKVNKVVLDSKNYSSEVSSMAWNVTLQMPDSAPRSVYKSRLINLKDRKAMDSWVTKEAEAIGFPLAIQPILVSYMINSQTPVYLKDQEATDAAKAQAAEQVPVERVVYKPGEKPLIKAGTELDRAGYEVLQTEDKLYLASLEPWQRYLHKLGPSSIVLLITFGLIGAVMSLKRRVAENTLRGLAMALMLLACMAMAVLIRSTGPDVAIGAAVGSSLLAAVIITIAYDQLFAMVVSGLLCILVAMSLRLSMGGLVITLAACVVVVSQLRELRNRGKLIRAGFVTGLVVAAGVWGAGLTERNMYPKLYASLANESLLGFIGSLAVGFFVLGVLPFVERIFKVTTAMTLLELSDVNQPLLRRLAQAAPGTYNHSLSVATIAEAAADTIGANGLLVRVGAYYHDIGKMNKPQYFVENQGGGPNRHEKLSPAMSLLIIVGHVKDGMEMAREARLPPVLHHFIESHHGTTLVEYFYHTAQQRTANDPDAAQPSEFEFRYPGPKPSTREAAILLLSDSVEAGCRTMNDPTAGRIEQFVHTMAMKRLMDGQFSECGLTLAELARVEAALVKSLCGIYHSRIAYPGDEKSTKNIEQTPVVAG